KEIDAASAVISLWDAGGNVNRRPDGSSDHQHSGSPCLNHIWVRVVDGEISLTATLRSNDMFAAWPANAMGLRALQQHIRDEIARRS
ncbi:thymidylate synthase, partial [Microcoleus sp. HI-ES]|nr:thymidylate synthase [Microcoleus sp. HI-ES]